MDRYPRASPLGTAFPAPFLLTAPKETVSQVSPDGDLLSVRTESRQRCAGGRPRRTASAKDALLSSASFPPVPRCYEGPGQDVRPSLSGARSQDTRSAAFRCRSIVLAYSASDYQTAPSLAHAVTRRDPKTRQFTANARRAAAENSGFEYRLTPTPDGMWSSP